MANICNYEIRVKGSRQAALFVYAAMPCYNEKQICSESGTEDAYELHFTGDCKWHVDSYCRDAWDKEPLDLNTMALLDESGYGNEDMGVDYWYYTLREKSRVAACEIGVFCWSEESDFMEFACYKDGIALNKGTRKFAKSVRFDWDTISFVSKKPKKAAPETQPEASAVPEEELWEVQVLKKNTLRICAYRGNAADVVVPAQIGGNRVTVIGKKAFSAKHTKDKAVKKYLRTGLKRVILPDGIEAIEQSAFEDCHSLETIVIPNGVAKVGAYAFRDCAALTEITLPDSVITIGSDLFSGCSSLTGAVLPKDLKELPAYTFMCCNSLKRIVIPENITEIKNDTFRACHSLTEIVLPAGLVKIGGAAFENCLSLASIAIPEGVTEIEYFTFYSCRSLTEVVLPGGITKIGGHAFASCAGLKSIHIPEASTQIDKDTFEYYKELTIHAPAGSFAEAYAREQGIPFVAK